MILFCEFRPPHTLLFLMDPYNNSFLIHQPDMQHVYHAPQMTHNHNTFQKPPGAGITETSTSTVRRQAVLSWRESLPQRKIKITRQMLSSSSTPSDISEASLHALNTSSSFSPSPLRAYASLPGKSQHLKCVFALRQNLRALASIHSTFPDGYPFIQRPPFRALSDIVSPTLRAYTSPKR